MNCHRPGSLDPGLQWQGEPCMKKRMSTVILILVFFTGLSLMLYPAVSDWWNSFHQSRAIVDYTQDVENLNNVAYQRLLSAARDYNRTLLSRSDRFVLPESESKEYYDLLDISGTGIMGSIEIPAIDVFLPIYHGTDDAVLSVAIGHMEGSSLPVGGENTHCVLSGHRGLPSAKLFSNLDKLVVGDTFIIRTLDEILTYEVDQIRTVDPKEIDNLAIVPGEDLCTLVTCTPYGINTDRLLVKGHRVQTQQETTALPISSRPSITPYVVAAILVLLLLLILSIVIWAVFRKRFNKHD